MKPKRRRCGVREAGHHALRKLNGKSPATSFMNNAEPGDLQGVAIADHVRDETGVFAHGPWHRIANGAIGDTEDDKDHKEPAGFEHSPNLAVGGGLVADIHSDVDHVGPIEHLRIEW